ILVKYDKTEDYGGIIFDIWEKLPESDKTEKMNNLYERICADLNNSKVS
ncbi:MAG: hypothetical protein K1000chlam2_01780, partial [Chlamydiae bacterium]|nr:hypothetical protein [Chlamydiota bacterium]